MDAIIFKRALKFAAAGLPPGPDGLRKEWQKSILIEFQEPNRVFIVGTNGERLHYVSAESPHFCGNSRFVARPGQNTPESGSLMFMVDAGGRLQAYRDGFILPLDCEPCGEYGDWRKIGFLDERPPHGVAEGWADLGYMMTAAATLEPFVPRNAAGLRPSVRMEAHINKNCGVVWKATTGARPFGSGILEAAAIITGRTAG